MDYTRINLGSGYRKKNGFINLDNRPETSPDILCDLTEGLPFKDNSVDEVWAQDLLEHIPIGKVVPLIEAIYRVLKVGGRFISLTPSTDGRGAFQDPTHCSFWNYNSWLYYMDDAYRHLYGIKAKFSGTVTDMDTDRNTKVIHTFANLIKEPT
jgi:predicted SAM-dependent methyltransferase